MLTKPHRARGTPAPPAPDFLFLFLFYFIFLDRARRTPAPPDIYIPSYVTHATSYVAYALVWGAADGATQSTRATPAPPHIHIKLQVPNPGVPNPGFGAQTQIPVGT